MNTKVLTMIAALLAAGNLNAQDLQKLADSMSMPELKAGATELPMPKADGAKVELLGADYSEIISKNGKIAPVLSDTPVNVSFKLSKGNESAISKDYQVMVKAAKATEGNPCPTTVPSILEWKGGKGFCKAGTTVGGVSAVAELLCSDMKAIGIANVKQLGANAGEKPAISLSLYKGSDLLGKEGYRMVITPDHIAISANTEQGLVWGTRTLLQLIRQYGDKIPCGVAVDVPRYPLRGFMLDVGRLPISLDYIKDVVRLMSWYKMNDLQLHLNDNYIFHEEYVDAGLDPAKESYSAFRLESKCKGKDGTPLTAQDLSYSKKQFAELIAFAKKHGVNIVPEFDSPGHALSFTRVRPDLIYQGPMGGKVKRRCEMLDAANPETVRFVGSVYDEYLKPDKKLGKPVFAGCPAIHIGADEFFGGAEDYRKYTDSMLKFIKSRGYTPRVWGSLNHKQGKTPVLAKGVQMNLWNGGWAKAWDSINQGYDIINTNDGQLYVVPFANYYRMDKDLKGRYNNWIPNSIGGETVPAGHPQLLGAAFAIWNDSIDRKHNGYGAYDIWNIISSATDTLSQKMWGTATVPMSYEDHEALVQKLGDAPNTKLTARPNFKSFQLQPKELPVKMNKGVIAPSYKLSMELQMDKATPGEEQVLLSGKSGELLAADKEGNVAFRRDDTICFSFNYKLPVGEKVKMELVGEDGMTKLLINGKEEGQLMLMNKHKRTQDLVASFTLPMQVLGKSFQGKVFSLDLDCSKSGNGNGPAEGDVEVVDAPDTTAE